MRGCETARATRLVFNALCVAIYSEWVQENMMVDTLTDMILRYVERAAKVIGIDWFPIEKSS
jgi:hypothetical protein